MAITLEANYSKKLGLPNYSSHQFSVSVKTELNNIDQIEAECTKLYATLQEAVDTEIQHSGFLPGQTPAPATNGTGNGTHANDAWNCSDKQRGLLLNLVTEQALEKEDISILSSKRFGKEVKALNKLEMSGLLTELLETYANGSGKRKGSSRQTGAPARR